MFDTLGFVDDRRFIGGVAVLLMARFSIFYIYDAATPAKSKFALTSERSHTPADQ
jgi:hypothetical protein